MNKAEVISLINNEDGSGVVKNVNGNPNYSSHKGGRYWFNSNAGLISHTLLLGLVLYAKITEGVDAVISVSCVKDAKETYINRSNGTCLMDKDMFPILQNMKFRLDGELCIDELEAIYSLAIHNITKHKEPLERE